MYDILQEQRDFPQTVSSKSSHPGNILITHLQSLIHLFEILHFKLGPVTQITNHSWKYRETLQSRKNHS